MTKKFHFLNKFVLQPPFNGLIVPSLAVSLSEITLSMYLLRIFFFFACSEQWNVSPYSALYSQIYLSAWNLSHHSNFK